jgi:dual specificity phosphatase 12
LYPTLTSLFRITFQQAIEIFNKRAMTETSPKPPERKRKQKTYADLYFEQSLSRFADLARDSNSKAPKIDDWHEPRIVEIVPGLLVGNVGASINHKLLQDNNIHAIVSATRLSNDEWYNSTQESGTKYGHHQWIPCADKLSQNLLPHLTEICDFIEYHASSVLKNSISLPVKGEETPSSSETSQDSTGNILVHCQVGFSRSPTIIIAYLMRKYKARYCDVLTYLKTKQRAKPNMSFKIQLCVWEETGYKIWENEAASIPKATYREFLDDLEDIYEEGKLEELRLKWITRYLAM